MNSSWVDTLHIDRVVALCYSGYPERTQPLMLELGRVGLSDVAEIVYTCNSPVDGLLMKVIPHVHKLDRQPGQFNAVMGHYGIAKTSIALGCDNVLVLEDDCRFLKDLSKIDDAIAQAPDTWDGLTFDAFVWKGENTSP